MKKYCIFGLMFSILPALCMAQHPRVTELIRIKQEKMEQLEKCSGTTKGLKIAGISTLGVTAVGVAGNIAEAVVINKYDKKIADVDSKISTTQSEIDQKLKDNIDRQNREDERQRRIAEEQNKAAQDESRRLKNVAAQDIATISTRGYTLGDIAASHGYVPEQLPSAMRGALRANFADAMIRFISNCRALIGQNGNGIKEVSLTSSATEKWNPQTMAEVSVLDENAILPDLNEHIIAQCVATECDTTTHTLSNGTCVPNATPTPAPQDNNGTTPNGDQNGNNNGQGGNNQGNNQGGENNQGGNNNQGGGNDQGGNNNQGNGDNNGTTPANACTAAQLNDLYASEGKIEGNICVPTKCKGDLVIKFGTRPDHLFGNICDCPDGKMQSGPSPTTCVTKMEPYKPEPKCTADQLNALYASEGKIEGNICVPTKCKGDLVVKFGTRPDHLYGNICDCPDGKMQSGPSPTTCVAKMEPKKPEPKCTADQLNTLYASEGKIEGNICVPTKCKGDLVIKFGTRPDHLFGNICECPEGKIPSGPSPTTCVAKTQPAVSKQTPAQQNGAGTNPAGTVANPAPASWDLTGGALSGKTPVQQPAKPASTGPKDYGGNVIWYTRVTDGSGFKSDNYAKATVDGKVYEYRRSGMGFGPSVNQQETLKGLKEKLNKDYKNYGLAEMQ